MEFSFWNPSLAAGRARSCHIPYGAKTTGISAGVGWGGVSVTLKWYEVSCFVRIPAEGEIEGVLWKPPLGAPAQSQEMVSLQELVVTVRKLALDFYVQNLCGIPQV